MSSSSTAVAAAASTTTTPEPKNEQEVISIYKQMQSEMQGLIQQLTKMEIELNEHRYVFHVLLFCVYIICMLWNFWVAKRCRDSRESMEKISKCGI